jgi:phenol/toluene 2-monooxygenase (NADH) P5/A5
MSYQVIVEPTGEVIEVDEDQTILQAALRQGVWLPFACGHGTCATCKCDLVEGDVDHGDASPFALMDMERDEGKILVCCAKPESDLVVAADIDIDPDFEGYHVGDYSAEVTAITDLTPTIKELVLKLDRPMQFQAGQYINLDLPGINGSRAFSIANSPAIDSEIKLQIRQVPEGAATEYIHEKLQVGEVLTPSGPYGQFFVRKSDMRDVIFIAGGSGLSSPESMILDLLENGDRRKIYLFHGARNIAELYHDELFKELADKHENFVYIPALNEPEADDNWLGFKGFVHEAAVAYFDGKFAEHKAYLCGPSPMIDAAITALMQGRLFEKDIHMEKFLTAADGTDGKQRSALFRRI